MTIGIGDFSKATQLTVKTLRHYHQIGLLEPAEVDAVTGYRRYGIDQIQQALIISRFRALEMPLDAIQEVLAATDLEVRNAVIAAHLERLEAALEQTRAAAESLRGLLTDPGPLGVSIEHVAVPATPVAAITGTIDFEADGAAWFHGALAELRAGVAAQHATAVVAGPAGGVYADSLFTEARGEATLFLPYDGEIRPVGRIETLVLPAAELATIEHAGPQSEIDRAYGALASHVANHAVAVPGPIREHYLVDRSDTPDESSWRTRIGWPIFRTGA